MNKPNIKCFSAGGTWCMKSVKQNESPSSEIKVAKSLALGFNPAKAFPLINDLCKSSFEELYALDSSNLLPAHWTNIATRIAEQYHDYDGFVVLHGTDTLGYTASGLSFALRGLQKPVIISGAQLEMTAPGSDAPGNIVNSFRVASLKLPKENSSPAFREVAVVFGSKIIRATRCRKVSERDLQAFESLNIPDLGKIQLSIRLDPRLVRTGLKNDNFHCVANFADGVVLLHLFPGFSPELLFEIGRKSAGLVLACFGAGNIPCSTSSYQNPFSLEEPVYQLVADNIPVVVTTQCTIGQAEYGLYETGSAAKRAGAIIANDMTPECAFVKLSWLLANEDQWPKDAARAKRGGPGWKAGLRKAMLTNIAGEVCENSSLFGLYGIT